MVRAALRGNGGGSSRLRLDDFGYADHAEPGLAVQVGKGTVTSYAESERQGGAEGDRYHLVGGGARRAVDPLGQPSRLWPQQKRRDGARDQVPAHLRARDSLVG